ncbi:MAG: acyl-CoA dehydrogenase [bacterium]|nr:acyl-CoA dehydrogenase [bacterium]
MDFSDSPEEAAFRAEASVFLDENAPEKVPNPYQQVTREAQLAALPGAREWHATQTRDGWGVLLWPVEHGGRGLGPIEQMIWNQEKSKRNLTESIFSPQVGMVGPTIIAHGTEEQKEQHLAGILNGDTMWCQLFSEPGAGSDLAGLATRGVRDGDDWIITGQKTWSSFADIADWGFMLVRTDPSLPKHEGISYFLVDMKQPGIETQPLRQMTGSELFCEVFFNEVRVPDSNRLGPVGGGWSVANTTLLHERMMMGGMGNQFSFDNLLRDARERGVQFDDVTLDEIGRVQAWSKALDMLNARIMTKVRLGKNPAAESSVMKLAMARLYSRCSDLGLRVQGAEALIQAGEWQKHFLTSPAFHIAGGSDEIQKNTAAERVLGLPRDPYDLRGTPFDQLPRSAR